MPADDANNSSGFRMAVVVEGGLGLLAVFTGWLFGVQLHRLFPDTSHNAGLAILRGVVATVPLLAAFWYLVRSRWPAARRLRSQATRLIGELFHRTTWAELALIAALAGVGEELLFRGVLQSLLCDWTNDVAGLIVASLIFGLFHALSTLYFILATLVGAYLGWLMLEFQDLLAPIVTHALYDFIALIYLTRRPLAA